MKLSISVEELAKKLEKPVAFILQSIGESSPEIKEQGVFDSLAEAIGSLNAAEIEYRAGNMTEFQLRLADAHEEIANAIQIALK